MLLLNATALVAMSLARGAGASLERARLVTAGWAMATRTLDAPVALVGDSLCTTPNASGADGFGSVTGRWTERLNGAWRERDLSVTLTPSPWLGAPHRVAMQSARSCR
jgi:kynureninase